MIKLVTTLAAIGVLACIAPAQAVDLGDCYSGNTEGDKAWANLDLTKYGDIPSMTASKSGGEAGSYLDLSDWDCLPTYLVIKGGPGYVVLGGDDLTKALEDGKVWVSETCLVNGGGNPPGISHWAAFGCESVPEPSTVLASLSALAFGALMLRRRLKA
jgi:hypothetical protein